MIAPQASSAATESSGIVQIFERSEQLRDERHSAETKIQRTIEEILAEPISGRSFKRRMRVPCSGGDGKESTSSQKQDEMYAAERRENLEWSGQITRCKDRVSSNFPWREHDG